MNGTSGKRTDKPPKQQHSPVDQMMIFFARYVIHQQRCGQSIADFNVWKERYKTMRYKP